VYHIDIRRTKPGLMEASNAPRRKRFVAIPAKDVHAGVVMRMIPQAMVVSERTLPMRRRWRKYPAGNCANRYPK